MMKIMNRSLQISLQPSKTPTHTETIAVFEKVEEVFDESWHKWMDEMLSNMVLVRCWMDIRKSIKEENIAEFKFHKTIQDS